MAAEQELKPKPKLSKPAVKNSKQKAQSKHWDAKVSHKVRHTVLTVFLTLLLVGGGAYGYAYFTRDVEASIQNSSSSGTTRTIESTAGQKGSFNEEVFLFELPGDWKKTGQLTTGPYRKYSYQSTLKNADNRYVDVYMDGIPLDMAVNKAVAVRGEGSRLSHGMASDNCTTFTAKTANGGLSVPAKWDGVDFLCDLDAVTRNVVGTSAPGSINKVELVDTGFTKHSFFFVYTDNNFTPDYTIFYEMLDSFKMK
jgi:hypothetical protein